LYLDRNSRYDEMVTHLATIPMTTKTQFVQPLWQFESVRYYRHKNG